MRGGGRGGGWAHLAPRRWFAGGAGGDARAAELRAELARGYFGDFRELKDDPRGKLWATVDRPVPADKARPMPLPAGPVRSFAGGPRVLLADELRARAAAPALLLMTLKRQSAGKMTDTWRAPFVAQHKHLPCLELYLEPMVGYWLLGPVLRPAIARDEAFDAARRRDHFYYNAVADVRRLCSDLHMRNRLVGYAFLVDAQLRLRWRACGIAAADELEMMHRVTERLEAEEARRIDKMQPLASSPTL